MRSVRRTGEQVGWRAAAQPVTLVGAPFVVELHEAIETALHRVAAREVLATKLDPPVLVQDRALQPFDEAVGPRMPRQRPRMSDTEPAAGVGERRFELGAPVGEDALQRPTRASVERPQDVAQEERGRRSRQLWQQPGHPVRARGVASGDLPHFADALELADVERVEAHELARLRGLDVAPSGAARLGQAPAGPVGEQPARPGAVVLEQREAIASARQPGPAQEALDGAGRHAERPLAREVSGHATTAPGRPRQRHAQDQALGVPGDLPGSAALGVLPPWMQAIGAILFEPVPPAIEQRARDARLLTGQRHAVELLGAPHDTQAHRQYAVVEGHPFVLPQSFPWPGTDSGKDRTDGPLVAPSLSTLLRVGTL